MMVIAVRGEQTAKVSKSFYEKVLKKKGFKIKEDEKKVVHHMDSEHEEAGDMMEDQQEEKHDDVESIPISEMNKSQLMEFAKKHNIDTRNAKTVPEARRIIQKAIRESKM